MNDLVIGGARGTDPETSHEAGGSTLFRVGQALLLLRLYGEHPNGLTAVEAGTLLGFERPDRRVSDLTSLGLLAPVLDEHGRLAKRTPFNVPSRMGRPGRVLAITAQGRRELDRQVQR